MLKARPARQAIPAHKVFKVFKARPALTARRYRRLLTAILLLVQPQRLARSLPHRLSWLRKHGAAAQVPSLYLMRKSSPAPPQRRALLPLRRPN